MKPEYGIDSNRDGRRHHLRQYWPVYAVGLGIVLTTLSVTSFAQTWTDRNLTDRSRIRKVHLDELRSTVDNQRASRGLSAVTWTDPVIQTGRTRVRKVHIDQLRTAINELRTAAGLSVITYTDPTITAGATRIKAGQHIAELRRVLEEVVRVPLPRRGGGGGSSGCGRENSACFGTLLGCCSGYTCNTSRGMCEPRRGCTCTAWINEGCGQGGGCASNRMWRTRVCTPSGCQSESRCRTDSACESSCTRYAGCPYGAGCGGRDECGLECGEEMMGIPGECGTTCTRFKGCPYGGGCGGRDECGLSCGTQDRRVAGKCGNPIRCTRFMGCPYGGGCGGRDECGKACDEDLLGFPGECGS